jgi:hypothetical protein
MSTLLPKLELTDGRVVVQVGTCGGMPEPEEYVRALLAAAGIEAYFHGSRANAIMIS